MSTGSDVTLGAKLGLHDGEQSAVALLFGLNVPAGPRDLRGTVDPSVSLLWDQSLLGELGLAVNLGVELTGERHDRFARWSWAAALAHPVSERLSGYVEIFGDGPEVAGGRYQLAVDGGLLYLLNPDTQFDIAYARGLSAGGFDWSLGLGFSRRF